MLLLVLLLNTEQRNWTKQNKTKQNKTKQKKALTPNKTFVLDLRWNFGTLSLVVHHHKQRYVWRYAFAIAHTHTHKHRYDPKLWRFLYRTIEVCFSWVCVTQSYFVDVVHDIYILYIYIYLQIHTHTKLDAQGVNNGNVCMCVYVCGERNQFRWHNIQHALEILCDLSCAALKRWYKIKYNNNKEKDFLANFQFRIMHIYHSMWVTTENLYNNNNNNNNNNYYYYYYYYYYNLY